MGDSLESWSEDGALGPIVIVGGLGQPGTGKNVPIPRTLARKGCCQS